MPDRTSLRDPPRNYPPALIGLTVTLVVLPSLHALVAEPLRDLDAGPPPLVYTLSRWTAAMLAMFCFVLAYGRHRSGEQTVSMAFGYPFLVIGVLHGLVALVVNGALWPIGDLAQAVPWLGTIGSAGKVLLLLLGGVCAHQGPGGLRHGNLALAAGGSLVLGAGAVAAIYGTTAHPNPPTVIFPGQLIHRPYDFVLIPLLLLTGYLLHRCRFREPGVFIPALFLSLMPMMVAHLHLALGSVRMMDRHAEAAQFLIVISHLIILIGLATDYSDAFRREVYATRRYEGVNRMLLERTGEVERANGLLVTEMQERRRIEAELRAAAARLEASNRELEHFAHIASHDLQEPLRKIQAFGDRLRRKCADQLGETGLDWMERMLSAAKQMNTLIADLLAYSRVNQKSPVLEPVDLGNVVNGVLNDLEMLIERTGGRVEVGALPVILGEAWQIRQLMQNLIGNALKFHRPDTPPVVRVSGAAEGGRSEIRVEDNGIGIESKHAAEVFLPFRRLHGRGQYDGTGMGLAITRRIVERHGGSIEIGAAPTGGAVFLVRLPAPSGEREDVCMATASRSAS